MVGEGERERESESERVRVEERACMFKGAWMLVMFKGA